MGYDAILWWLETLFFPLLLLHRNPEVSQRSDSELRLHKYPPSNPKVERRKRSKDNLNGCEIIWQVQSSKHRKTVCKNERRDIEAEINGDVVEEKRVELERGQMELQ